VPQGVELPVEEETKSEKEKAAAKRGQLDVMVDLLKEEHVAISLLDYKAQKLLKDTEELYAAAEARANANIKL
jgi:hypothetical protein